MTDKKNPGYLMLIRTSDEWMNGMGPEELEQQMRKFTGWVNSMSERGILIGANPLEDEGVIVSGSSGNRTVTDGPFAESKEAIGGYFYLNVDTLDKAIEEARACPALDYGCTMEVRPVAANCPLIERAGLLEELRYGK